MLGLPRGLERKTICSKLNKDYSKLKTRRHENKRLLAALLSLKIVKKLKMQQCFVCTLAESNYSVESLI